MKELTCKQFIDFLNDYLDDSLAGGERAEFERHLEICPDCVNYLQTYRDTIRIARTALTENPSGSPVPRAPEDLVRAILAAREKGRR